MSPTPPQRGYFRLSGEMSVTSHIRAVLFDLDDTLLENNMEHFLRGYFGLLTPHVAHLVSPDKSMPALLAVTRVMVENSDSCVMW
jgi:hypothetical protein